MNPVSPDADNEHSQPPDQTIEGNPEENSEETSDGVAKAPKTEPSSPVLHGRRWTDKPAISPLENLQRRYTDQLSQDIEQLEAEKAQLQSDIAALKQNYKHLQTTTAQVIAPHENSAPLISEKSATSAPVADSAKNAALAQPPNDTPGNIVETIPATPGNTVPTAERGPRLPGEKEVPPLPIAISPSSRTAADASSKERRVELPTPATSQQRRQQRTGVSSKTTSSSNTAVQSGLTLSAIGPWTGAAITTLITAWHYGLVSTLHQGGSWLGFSVGQLGTGFVPAVALLWLRMLVIVPSIVLLAPQLHRTTWEDLLDWFYSPEQLKRQLFLPLIGSGIALFFSQVFLYQSIGIIGPAIGTALLFLYPLSTLPLGLSLQQEKALTPFGLLAVVAIAMGGLLVAKPTFTTAPTAIGLSILASLALGLYIVLTNRCYRLRCHPIPTAIIQFSTVAVLSSLVLLVKPLKLVNISWLSFCLWGLLVGVLMLGAYLFTYASLLNIRSKTAIVAAATPVVTLLLGLGFTPRPSLQIIQWTGIMLVTIGGIALGKEKLGKEKLGKEKLGKETSQV